MRTFTVLILTFFLVTACSQKKTQEEVVAKTDTLATVSEKSVQASVSEVDSTEANMPTVIDFSAVWCGPCQQFAPTFHELEKKFEGKAKFQTLDVDEDPATADNYHITQIPTVVLLNKDGKEVKRLVGLKSEKEISDAIETLIK